MFYLSFCNVELFRKIGILLTLAIIVYKWRRIYLNNQKASHLMNGRSVINQSSQIMHPKLFICSIQTFSFNRSFTWNYNYLLIMIQFASFYILFCLFYCITYKNEKSFLCQSLAIKLKIQILIFKIIILYRNITICRLYQLYWYKNYYQTAFIFENVFACYDRI